MTERGEILEEQVESYTESQWLSPTGRDGLPGHYIARHSYDPGDIEQARRQVTVTTRTIAGAFWDLGDVYSEADNALFTRCIPITEYSPWETRP